MLYLTENQIVALELLATYKYLTSSQFVKMGIYKKRGYLTNALKVLIDIKNPLVAKHDFNPISGKLESFYYLTKYGKNLLIDEMDYMENQIKAPKGLSSIYLKDYQHRKRTIDFHIGLRRWVESNNSDIHFFNYYFDKSGSNKSSNKSQHVYALNKIQLDKDHSFIPDATTMFSLDGQKHLYLFEQHNGQDCKRLLEQLQIHSHAIHKKIISEKYNLKNSHQVVVVCEYESVKDTVIQRLLKIQNIGYYNNFFLFKTNVELDKDFYNNWTLIDGTTVNFLQNIKI